MPMSKLQEDLAAWDALQRKAALARVRDAQADMLASQAVAFTLALTGHAMPVIAEA